MCCELSFHCLVYDAVCKHCIINSTLTATLLALKEQTFSHVEDDRQLGQTFCSVANSIEDKIISTLIL